LGLRFWVARGSPSRVVLLCVVPFYNRHYHPGQLQFITTSTYRKAKLFQRERFRRDFVEVLDQVRGKLGFLLMGWVLIPEHFHLLIKPEPAESTREILKELKQQTAFRILTALRDNRLYPWYHRTLSRLRLPSTVHDESRHRVWQRRFYPFNVYSQRKRLKELDYMHNNPVKQGLVSSPHQWPWSSRWPRLIRFLNLPWVRFWKKQGPTVGKAPTVATI